MHRVGSLVKRRLLHTHQSSVDDTRLQLYLNRPYLNEYVLRFNRWK